MTADQAMETARRKDPQADVFVVRFWDGFDGEWMDVDVPGTEDHVKKIWSDRTDQGTKKTSYNDIDYYAIYPATTIMRFSEGRSQTR